MKQIDLAWLAGIIDGEGSVYCAANKKRKACIETGITVETVSPEINNKIRRIYKRERIHFYEYKSHTKNYPSIRFMVRNQIDCTKLLKILLPYLTCKKKKARLMIQYCNYRKQNYGKVLDKKSRKLINQISPRALNSFSKLEKEQEKHL